MDILQPLLFDYNRKYTDSFTPEQRQKERDRISQQCRKARLAGTPATLTLDEWFTILNYYNGLCAYCKETPFNSIEHILSIKRGGGTTALNCVPACNRCNTLKNSKLAYKTSGEILVGWFTEDELRERIYKDTGMKGAISTEAIEWMIKNKRIIKRQYEQRTVYHIL